MKRTFEATISGLFISQQQPPRTRKERQEAPGGAYLVSAPVASIAVTLEGFAGDRHAGMTRAADARVPFYPRGTPIRNTRQVSLVSEEELAELAAALCVAQIAPTWLGANIVTRGLPRLSHLPAGTRLFFPAEATIVIAEQNAPCSLPGKVLAREFPADATIGGRFVRAARDRRGLVAWVERAGAITVGDTVTVALPPPVDYPLP